MKVRVTWIRNILVFAAPGAFTAFNIMEATSAQKVATIGGGASVGNAPKDNMILFGQEHTTFILVDQELIVDHYHLQLALGQQMRAYLMVVIVNNTSLFMDGDNTTSSVVGTKLIQYISSIMINPYPYGLIGNCYEVAFWNSDLSTANRNALGAYAQ